MNGFFGLSSLKTLTNLIGTICLWNISRQNLAAETGYVLHPSFQGKGMMHEALSTVIEFGFHNIKLSTIKAYTLADNKSSIKPLEKNNFKKISDVEVNHDSKEVIYSLTKLNL